MHALTQKINLKNCFEIGLDTNAPSKKEKHGFTLTFILMANHFT